jgi:hypothetical protein
VTICRDARWNVTFARTTKKFVNRITIDGSEETLFRKRLNGQQLATVKQKDFGMVSLSASRADLISVPG